MGRASASSPARGVVSWRGAVFYETTSEVDEGGKTSESLRVEVAGRSDSSHQLAGGWVAARNPAR